MVDHICTVIIRTILPHSWRFHYHVESTCWVLIRLVAQNCHIADIIGKDYLKIRGVEAFARFILADWQFVRSPEVQLSMGTSISTTGQLWFFSILLILIRIIIHFCRFQRIQMSFFLYLVTAIQRSVEQPLENFLETKSALFGFERLDRDTKESACVLVLKKGFY